MFESIQPAPTPKLEVLASCVQIFGFSLFSAHLFRHSAFAPGSQPRLWKAIAWVGLALWLFGQISTYALRRKRQRETTLSTAH